MTRKDYETIAAIIKSMDGDEIGHRAHQHVVDCFVLGLRARFTNFDWEKFRAASEWR